MFDQKNEISKAPENVALHKGSKAGDPNYQVSSPRCQGSGGDERNEEKIRPLELG